MGRRTVVTAAAGVALAAVVVWCGVEPEPPREVLTGWLCAAVPVDQVATNLAIDAPTLVTEPLLTPWLPKVACNLKETDGTLRGFVSIGRDLTVPELLPLYQGLATDSDTEDRSRPDVVEPLTVQGREAYFVVIDHPGSVDRNQSLTIQVTEDSTLEVLLGLSDEQRGDYTDPAPLIAIAEAMLPQLQG